MPYSKRKMVLVEWRDAMHEHHGWVSQHIEHHSDDIVESLGWLIRKDKASITIAQSDGMDNVANTLQVPMPMVRHIRYLQIANEPPQKPKKTPVVSLIEEIARRVA